MRTWILENTNVDKEKYDSILNVNTIYSDDFDINERDKFTIRKDHPFYHIENFTLKRPTRLRCYLHNIKKDKKYYFYKDVKFKVLAKDVPKLKKELYSKERKRNCFFYAGLLANMFKGAKITTALCDDWAVLENKKFVHSFTTLTSLNGIEIVMDATLNIIMERSKYLELLNARILSEIDRDKADDDLNYLYNNNLGEDVCVYEYLCFPEEVMEGVKKYIKTK